MEAVGGDALEVLAAPVPLDDAVDGVTRRELFRQAAENRLIDDVELWMSFHAARNETSHTYDNETAEEVSETAQHFAAAAQSLLTSLRARND
jgi:nucleotidyltransferase substrate binding protein (TIGR01987 family)